MKTNSKMSMKDRLTIHIRKQKPAAWWVLLIVAVVLLAALVVMGMTTKLHKASAPEVLTADDVSFRMTVAGNISIDDSIRTRAGKYGYASLLRGLRSYWEDSDCVIANFAGPILRYNVDHYKSRNGVMEESSFLRPAALRGFLDAGITMPSFANEQTFNYGTTGIRSTLSVLDEYNTEYLGIAENNEKDFYKVMEFTCTAEDGTEQTRTVSVMSINDAIDNGSTVTANRAGILNSTMSSIRGKIFEMSQSTDLVVIYLSSGKQNAPDVTADQRELSKELIDAGADIIVGTHSRMVQPVERYGEGLIIHDLGTVLSTTEYSMGLDGALLDITVQKDGTVYAHLAPTRLNDGRPEITNNWFYQKRITKTLTSALEDTDYKITDTGAILIEVGKLAPAV